LSTTTATRGPGHPRWPTSDYTESDPCEGSDHCADHNVVLWIEHYLLHQKPGRTSFLMLSYVPVL